MNREYALPGYIAVALALLFPVYWISRLGVGGASFEEAFHADVTRLDAWDLLFVLIGVMEIYLYFSLRKLLQERLQGTLPAAVLLLMAIVVGVFHATVVFDLVFAIGPEFTPGMEDRLVVAAAVVAISGLFVYAVLGFALSIMLLLPRAESPPLLKLFAALLMACCVLQFTIVFGILNVALFPVVLLLLAIYFLRGDHQVEVV